MSHKSADLIYFMAEAQNLSWGVSLEGEVEVYSEIDFKKYNSVTNSIEPSSSWEFNILLLIQEICWVMQPEDTLLTTARTLILHSFLFCKNLPLNCTEPDESHSDLYIQLFVAMSQVSRNLYIIYIFIEETYTVMQ